MILQLSCSSCVPLSVELHGICLVGFPLCVGVCIHYSKCNSISRSSSRSSGSSSSSSSSSGSSSIMIIMMMMMMVLSRSSSSVAVVVVVVVAAVVVRVIVFNRRDYSFSVTYWS